MTERILTTDDLWLPGDVLGGALLAGWAGPVVDAGHERVATAWPWPTVVVTEMHSPAPNMRHAQASGLRLDCNRPEVRDRLARMLACERGEPGSAPGEGWVPGPGGWAKPGARGFDLAMVCREDMTDDAEWYVYDEHGDGVTSGTCTTMLEAIEAADAALEADRAR